MLALSVGSRARDKQAIRNLKQISRGDKAVGKKTLSCWTCTLLNCCVVERGCVIHCYALALLLCRDGDHLRARLGRYARRADLSDACHVGFDRWAEVAKATLVRFRPPPLKISGFLILKSLKVRTQSHATKPHVLARWVHTHSGSSYLL